MATGLIPIRLKGKWSVARHELKALEPGSLYITISVPRTSFHEFCNSNATISYPTSVPEHFDLASYEVSCAKGVDKEEFEWGLYYHLGYGNGTWYELRRVSSTIDAGMDRTLGSDLSNVGTAGEGDGANAAGSLPFYTLSRQTMVQSPRLQARVAAMIKVLRMPDMYAKGLTPYLDWLALQTVPSAVRSFIWATSMYLRTRQHVSTYVSSVDRDPAARDFTTTGFLREALDLAYKEVWYGLGGQLPRPLMASAFGVEILLDEAKPVNLQPLQVHLQNMPTDQAAHGESTQYVWRYVFHHAETGLHDTPWWSSTTYTGVAFLQAISIDSSV